MGKDFKDSYEQLKWEHALAEYRRILDFFVKFPNTGSDCGIIKSFADIMKDRKSVLEFKYPCLKDINE